MGAIIKREMKNYLKHPIFWIGIAIVIFGVYQSISPYLDIHYVTSEQEAKEMQSVSGEQDITTGYVPFNDEQRRQYWEEYIKESFLSGYEMNEAEAEAVIQEMKAMDIKEACAYLEEKYSWLGALTEYYAMIAHPGTMEEINGYIESKLKDKSFSWYFSRKFADFAGLFMGFFATILLAVLFLQDMRKNTYELLHTKPLRAWQYVLGKVAGGYLVCLTVLLILNLVFYGICLFSTQGQGFEVRLLDFAAATSSYILPNMLMIVCVYALTALLFKNPLPAVPFLFLYMLYSNMGSRNAEGIYGYYGRPLAIMVRFPGEFFETSPPPLALLNQSFLILAAVVIMYLSIQLWKRRRV